MMKALKRKLPLMMILHFLALYSMSIEIPVLLNFYIKPSSISTVIRSIGLKEYFRKLTTNVEVLYPTQVHHGLLLCKSKRSKTKSFQIPRLAMSVLV